MTQKTTTITEIKKHYLDRHERNAEKAIAGMRERFDADPFHAVAWNAEQMLKAVAKRDFSRQIEMVIDRMQKEASVSGEGLHDAIADALTDLNDHWTRDALSGVFIERSSSLVSRACGDLRNEALREIITDDLARLLSALKTTTITE